MSASRLGHLFLRLLGILGLLVLGGAFAADAPKTPRVPAPKDPGPEALPASTVRRLDKVEAALQDPDTDLRRLHAFTIKGFIASPNFGMMRTIPRPPPPEPEWSTEDVEREPQEVKSADLERLHLASLVGVTLGQFSPLTALPTLSRPPAPYLRKSAEERLFGPQKPSEPAPYQVRSVHLVGLVVHAAPTVYLDVKVMKGTAEAKTHTRPINAFEAAGLDQLGTGEDLFVRARGQELHLLGAIRATEACLKCHDGKRGDLLGAFSYKLVKTR